MKLRTLLCIVFLIGYATSSIAEITLTDSGLPFWDIQGVITKSDLKEFERAVEIMSKTTTVRLN